MFDSDQDRAPEAKARMGVPQRDVWGGEVALKEVAPPEASPRAPWEALEDPPDSPRWRSGLGQTLLTHWLPFWVALTPDERRRYLGAHPLRDGWAAWLDEQGEGPPSP